ncbi:hypothetical protein [Plantactinospora veratri]
MLVGTAPPGTAPWGWPGWAFWSVLCAAPITLRRVAPWWAVLLAVPIFVCSALTGAQPVTAAATFVLLTYTTAALLPLREAALAAGAVWGPAVAVALAEPPPPDFTEPSPRTWSSPRYCSRWSASSSAVPCTPGGPPSWPWRSGPGWPRRTSGPLPTRRSPTSAGGSPASCTTSSRTTSA